jgi:hypothetical protein
MEKCIYHPGNRTDVLLDHRKPLRERNLADERGEEERTSGEEHLERGSRVNDTFC